jgi:gluconokinase
MRTTSGSSHEPTNDIRTPFGRGDGGLRIGQVNSRPGHPLTDEDRAPWLAAIGGWLAEHDVPGGVVGCSALRRRYRDALRSAAPRLMFLHLDGDPAVLLQRVAERHDHFMPATLLTSQLATLEPLEADEAGVVLDFASPAAGIVSAFTATLQPTGDRS